MPSACATERAGWPLRVIDKACCLNSASYLRRAGLAGGGGVESGDVFFMIVSLIVQATLVSVNPGPPQASQFVIQQEGFANADSKIIGTVREGDDLAYAVVRISAKNQLGDFNRVEVMALKRSGTEWRMLLPEAVRVMAETFRHTMQSVTLKSDSVTVPVKPIK